MGDSSDDEESNPLASVLSGGALISSSKFLALVLGFLTQIVMARLLTETAYGDTVLALAVVGIGALVAKLGLDDGLMQQIPEHEDDPEQARGVARAGFTISLAAGSVVGGVVFLGSPVIADRVFNDRSLIPLLRIAAIGIPFVALRDVGLSMARGMRDAKPQALVQNLVQPVSRLTLISALILAGFSAAGAVTGRIGANVLAGILAVVLALRILPSLRGPTVPMYRQLLGFSIPLIAMQGMGLLNSQLDIYMLGYFLASTDVGVYNIGLQLGNLLIAILTTMAFLLPPVLTRLHKNGEEKEMLATYQGLTKWMVMLALPVFTVLFFAPKIVISVLFGTKYVDGATVLRILIIGNFLGIIAGMNIRSLIALGNNRIVSFIVFLQVVVNFTINYTLIPVYGIEGAAIALTTATLVGDIVGSAVLFRSHGLHPVHQSILTPIAFLSGLAVTAYAALTAIGAPVWIVIIVVGFGYPIIVIRYALDPRDEKILGLFEDRIGYELTFLRNIVTRFQ